MHSEDNRSRAGILAGGNWIVDQVKMVDVYPRPEQLANIRAQSQGTGGAPYNVLVNLAKLGAKFPLWAAGAIGDDALGQSILRDCRALRIDTKHLHSVSGHSTSYTDVMTELEGGRRTFFHNRGANAIWDGSDLNFTDIDARIFHLGYLLLLDTLDRSDDRYGTKAAELLATAQAAGLKTSVDVVSEDSDRFTAVVTPALKYIDYCIVNEIEAGKTAGFQIRRDNGQLDYEAVREAATRLLQLGVGKLAVIHFPEGGYALAPGRDELWQPSFELTAGDIAGAAGAGDAFCAGVLWGLHAGWELQRCLKTGVCVAASSLSHPTCTGGIRPLETTLKLAEQYRFRRLPYSGSL